MNDMRTVAYYQTRVTTLSGRKDKANGNIIKKLKRQIRALQNAGKA